MPAAQAFELLEEENKLQGKFFNALADDFEQRGVAVIERLRQEDRSGYIRIFVKDATKADEARFSTYLAMSTVSRARLRETPSGSRRPLGVACEAARLEAASEPSLPPGARLLVDGFRLSSTARLSASVSGSMAMVPVRTHIRPTSESTPRRRGQIEPLPTAPPAGLHSRQLRFLR